MTNEPASSQATRNPFLRRLVTGVLLLNALVTGIVCYSLQNSKTHYEDGAAIATRNISRVLDENVSGIFAKVDIALQSVGDEAQRELATGSITPGALDGFIIREHLRLPELISFRATNSAGDALYGAKSKITRTISLAHRNYFKLLRDSPTAGIVISKPVIGGISGKWMVIIARRFNHPDGTFAGLVYAGLGLDYLTQSFKELNVGRHGVIALLETDLSLVARYPEPGSVDADVGKKIVSPQLSEFMSSGQTAGSHTSVSSVDGVERAYSYHRLSHGLPFCVVAGLSTTEYLAGWRQEALKMALLWGAFCLCTLLSAKLFYGEWHKTRKAEESLLLLNGELEERVKERTAVAHTTNQKLEALNLHLTELVEIESAKNRAKDLQLIHHEKLASIGQLAAGVAHEINNPLGFISCNLSTLADYFRKIIQYDHLLRKHGDVLPPPTQQIIADGRKSLELEYILTDGAGLIAESLEGAERVKKIVEDLKSFSRVDTQGVESVVLSSCLESALNICGNELNSLAAIRKEYDQLPELLCNPGQLNQVFLNLLLNAGHAIEPPGEIVLRSWHDASFVYASVSDTGKGIPEQIRDRIFDPFFTTRDVGKGTGLGLSVSYEIVKNHGGEILVTSSPGRGSTFTVKLPRPSEDTGTEE
jgi:signal transduction histidine kinase